MKIKKFDLYLVATMGLSSCGDNGCVAFDVNKKTPIEMEKSDNVGRVLNKRLIRRKSGNTTLHKNVLLISFSNNTTYKVVIDNEGMFDKDIKEGDKIRLVLNGDGGYVEFDGEQYDIVTSKRWWNKANLTYEK